MRQKSPELMNRIREYAEKVILNTGRSPSTTRIASEVGITRGAVYKYLVAMDEQGLISYHDGEITTELTRQHNNSAIRADIVGHIPCGSPQSIDAYVEESVALPSSIFGDGDLFILHASGDSMIDAGIDDGDLVVVRKQESAAPGDIVAAMVDGENTLKRFTVDRKGHIWLHPENERLRDIPGDGCIIQGVAQHVIKAL